MPRSNSKLLLVATFAVTPLLTGCAGFSNTATSALPLASLRGHVHGGQQPISGAAIQLYAAGSTGYGSPATALLTSPVLTATDGSFDITGDYTCPSAGSQVYLVATGGDAGAGTNPASNLVAALGACSSLATTNFVTINEVSTVAAAYALGQFLAANGTDIGTSSTNPRGLANAFLTVPSLVDLATGLARTTTSGGNGIVPSRTLNTLANILAACVNTTGSNGVCGSLFANAHAPNDPSPADTLVAIRNIALHPALNIPALYGLPTGTPPFQPALSGPPNDWTISVAYTGGGLGDPGFPAIDSEGNLWVPNAGATILSAFSPTGVPLAPSGYTGGGLTQSVAAAIDLSGAVWISNGGSGSISKFSSTGSPVSPSSGFLAGTGAISGLAADANGSLFAAQTGTNAILKLASTGTLSATITGGGMNGDWAIVIDPVGNIWSTNHNAASISKFTSNGTPLTSSGYTGAGLYQPYQGAIDRNGNFWAADRFPSVSELTSSGVAINSAGYAIAYDTESIAVDGDNTIWTANTDGSITHLSTIGNALSPANGFQSGGSAGKGIALDASGNVWTTDSGNQIFELVGGAAPVTTPLVQALANNSVGTRP